MIKPTLKQNILIGLVSALPIFFLPAWIVIALSGLHGGKLWGEVALSLSWAWGYVTIPTIIIVAILNPILFFVFNKLKITSAKAIGVAHLCVSIVLGLIFFFSMVNYVFDINWGILPFVLSAWILFSALTIFFSVKNAKTNQKQEQKNAREK